MTIDTIRIFLHILGASVWVGGQIVLGSVVSGLRREHRDAAVVTGVWSLLSLEDLDGSGQIALALKILAVAASGCAAAAHSMSSSRAVKAIGGAFGSVTALVAMVLAVVVSTSS